MDSKCLATPPAPRVFVPSPRCLTRPTRRDRITPRRRYALDDRRQPATRQRQYFPRLLAVENDPRVKLIFEDGAHYVRSAAGRGERFDAVLIDSTDFSQAAPLFTNAFYQACRALVAPSADRRGGIVAYNVDSPQWHEPWVVRAHTQANELFVHAHLFQVYQPTFSSGHYSFMLASDSIHPFRTPPDWAAFEAKQIPTEYYSPDVHYAAFVLPAALQRRLGSTLRLQDLASAPHAFSQSSS